MKLCNVYNEQGEGRQKGGGDEWKGVWMEQEWEMEKFKAGR